MLQKIWFGLTSAIFLMILVPEHAQANEFPDSQLDEPSSLVGGSTINIWGSIIQVIIILILIIALILILVKFLAQRNRLWPGARSIQMLAGIHLGQHKSLQMIEVGRKIYIVGVGDNVQLIDKIEDEEEVAYILDSLRSEQSYSVRGSFSQLIRRLQKKENANELQSEWDETTFQRIFDQKMSKMSERRLEVEQMLQQYDGEEKRDD